MRLLCITDLHGDGKALEQIIEAVPTADIIVLGGDITNFGTPDQAALIVRRARDHCDTVLAVAGNCDSEEIDDLLRELGVSIFGRGAIVDGVGFYGVSAMPPWNGAMYELSEATIARALADGRHELNSTRHTIIVSHAPPYGTSVDRIRGGSHVGSTALRKHVEQFQPSMVLCGHIHEARGTDQIGDTISVNCGAAFRGFYALIDVDEKIHVELRQRTGSAEKM